MDSLERLALFIVLLAVPTSTSGNTNTICAPNVGTSTVGTCGFNKDKCGYTVQGRFIKHTGKFDYGGEVIPQGHENSSYIVCNWQRANLSTNNTLTSPDIKPGTYCMTFWHYMTGTSVGLSVFTSTGTTLIANITDKEAIHNWTQVSVSITENKPFKVLFEMLRATGFFSLVQTIGLDDIRIATLSFTTATKTSPTAITLSTLVPVTITGIINTSRAKPLSLYATQTMHTASFLSTSATETSPSAISSNPVKFPSSEGRPAGKDICKLSENNLVTVSGGCDFNNGSCGYKFPPYLWSIDKESTGMIIFGPTDNDIGLQQTFALFQSNDPHVNISTNADITTSTINSVTSDVCLKFLILMPNQNSKLDIYLMTESNNQSQLISEYKQTLISQWKIIELPIHVNEPFKIIFRSIKENNYGYIGIDNIKIYREKLPTTITPLTTTTLQTTTTIPTSTMTHPSTPTTTTTTATPTTETVPTTTSSTRSNPTTTIPPTTTPTTIRPTTITTPSTTISTISEATTMMQTSTTLKQSTAPDPTTTQMVTCSCSCPTFQSECVKTTSIPVTPIPQVCSKPEMDRVKHAHYSCNFDKDTCQYNVPVYPHLWERASYTFGNKAIGEIPGDQSEDHSGGYMLFNTYNNHVQSNQTHYFQTPVVSPNVSYCLSFWYITPTNHSNLAVFVTYTDNSPSKLLWTTKHQARTNWVHEYLGIHETQPFKLRFESKKESFFSFLGVDNVLISSAPPTSNTGSSTPLATSDFTTKSSQFCNCSCPRIDCHSTTNAPFVTAPPCGDLSLATKLRDVSCDFDDRNTCGYNIPIYPHLWEIHRFAYGDVKMGVIDGDSSTDRDGSYLLFNTDNYHVQPGQIDDVTSPWILNRNKTCLSFQYNMPTEKAVLDIYQNINGQKTILWEQSNTMTNGWIQANVLIPAGPHYKIIVSSTKTGLDSYFGVDNIELFTDLVL